MSDVTNVQNFNKSNIQFKGIPNQRRKLSPTERKMLNENMREALLQSSKNCDKIEIFQKYVLPIYKTAANAIGKIEKFFNKGLK